jgi:Tol biopolymer transport system component
MSLATGTRLGPYEILSQLGAGGMGEVYKARDTRLDRSVAIKVLPRHLSDYPELRERFEREAHAIASLQHPNICTLYDIGEQDGTHFLVMEYLEGETLAARLTKGPLPLDQILKISIEISDALDKAHRKGFTHRDIKPANIMLTKAGSKILDFGLAKLKPQLVRTDIPFSEMPTPPRGVPLPHGFGPDALTASGTILGTLLYMAPEQLEGRLDEVDARADIFSLGTVIYEMATGAKAFPGKSQASVIAAILKDDPLPMSSFQPLTPPSLERLVKICLAKDPDERWQSALDLCRELQWIREGGYSATAAEPVLPAASRWRRRLLYGAMGLAVWLVTAAAIWNYRSIPPSAAMRFSVTTPGPPTAATRLAVSPDGRSIAFQADDFSGNSQVWVRRLESLQAQPVAGTDRGGTPFWSPDGRFIGFFADAKLKIVSAAGGQVQTLVDAPSGRGGTWNRDGTIVFAPETFGGLARVSASGGDLTPLTSVDAAAGETSHRYPQFLPDGNHFLYFVQTLPREQSGVYVGSLDSQPSRRILTSPFSAAYAPPGYLLYMREDTLVAQAFDARRLELSGEPVPIADGIFLARNTGVANFSSSPTGVLAYLNSAAENRQLEWFDRAGQSLGRIGRPEAYGTNGPVLSPDGMRFASARGLSGGEDVWLWELASGTSSRFTFDPARDGSPVWSSDGRRIIFRSDRGGRYRFYQKNSTGAGEEEVIFESPTQTILQPQDLSTDGQTLLYTAPGENTGMDLWALPLPHSPDRKPFPYLQTPFNESQAQISPDGNWVAYASNELGRDEIFLQSFPRPGSKRQVSSGGGVQPRWRADGRELFYLALDQMLMSVAVRPGEHPELGTPVALFQTRLNTIGTVAPDNQQLYDVTSDGRRFLLSLPPEQAGPPITVILNWTAALPK